MIYKPDKEALKNAEGKTLPDIIDYNLKILFCGINPGLYTAAVGHHFARPGNRFWPALFNSGITPTLFQPHEELELLSMGYGITNIVGRATASADVLQKEEFIEGWERLKTKILEYKPAVLAILGAGAYRTAVNKKAAMGLQNEKVGDTFIWVLPSPSGLNANYHSADFRRLFSELKLFSDKLSGAKVH